MKYTLNILLLVCLLLLISNLSFSQFSDWQTFNGGLIQSRDIAEGDFDGDGDLDILIACPIQHKVAWIENLGGGTFSTQHLISFKNYWSPAYLTVEDFDGDTDIDFAVFTAQGELSWFENKGNGQFAAKQIIDNTLGSATTSLLVHELQLEHSDVDLDGDVDLIVVHPKTGDTYIDLFENDGAGNFSFATHLFTINTDGFYGMYVVDFDDDGDDDLFLSFPGPATGITALFWLENIDGFDFSLNEITGSPYGGNKRFIPNDFNEDGLIDLVGIQISAGSKIIWYQNLGGGVWAEEDTLSLEFSDPKYIHAYDVDDDGDQDFVVHDMDDDALYLLVKVSTDSLAPRVLLDYGLPAVQDMLTIDFDSDGDQDLIPTDRLSGRLKLFFNSSGDLSQKVYIDYPQYQNNCIVSGDLDGDGDQEVITAGNDSAQLFINRNIGNKTFDYQDKIADVYGCYALELFDPDNDGDLDLISTAYSTGELVWYENDGSGNLSPPNIISSTANHIREAYPSDVDGDGLTDILFGTYVTNKVAWVKNLGSGMWSSEILISTDHNAVNSIIAVDLDNDGDEDIAVVSLNDDKIVWYENLGGPFGPQQIISTNSDGPKEIYASDLDGDGDRDLVVVSYFDDKVVWFENNGSGSFSPEIIISDMVGYASSVKCEDFDNDGDQDIFVVGQKIWWFENDGMTDFGEPIQISYQPNNPYFGEIGDLDGDGDVDLLSSSDGSYEWYENYAIEPNQFRGEVYFDQNLNGQRDSAEIGMDEFVVLTAPGSSFAHTYSTGKFFVNIDPFELGVFEVSIEDLGYWEIVSDSLLYHVNVDSAFIYRDSLDFGLFPDTIVNDLKVNIIGGFPRCNDTINYFLDIKNIGTTLPSGVIDLQLHDSVTYYSSLITPDSIVGQHCYWSYDSLGFFDNKHITVEVIMPDVASIGLSLNSFLTVSVDSIPDTIYASVDVLHQSLVCGYDPNDKIADPTGYDSLGFIPAETEFLEYTIRFQNTGTDTAFNVRVEDWLDDNLDWGSIEILSYSHEMTFDISYTGKITFDFEDIMLPDSGTTFLGSQGYVKYRISLIEDLPIGTQINNFASIYFDLNPPVITNTEINTLGDCEDIIGEVILNSPICLNDTLLGSFPYLPELASVNWNIFGITSSDDNDFVWPADSIGIHELILTFSSTYCSIDTVLNIEVVADQLVELDSIHICNGDSTLVFGEYVIDEGIYFDTLSSVIYGCDSIVSQYVYVWNETITTSGETIICPGDSALIFGDYVMIDGIYYDTLTSIYGCDSILEHIVSTSFVEANITGLDDSLLCIEDLDYEVGGIPIGGDATGTGVSGGFFNPMAAGIGTHFVYYTYSNLDGCIAVDSLKLTVVDCLGLNDDELKNITVYPNPADNLTTIDFGRNLEGKYQLQITNEIGKVVYQSDFIFQNKLEIDLEKFSPGTYILTLFNIDGSEIKVVSKLIVE